MMDTKVCSKCLIEKSLLDFHLRKGYKYGRNSVCKICISQQNKAIHLTEDKLIKLRKKAKDYREKNFDKATWAVKRSIYKKLGLNISKEDYEKKLNDQNGLCLICNNPQVGNKKHLCLDHCHKTLKIRGFLCDNCNGGLGKFKDDIELLKRAIDYLEKFKSWDGV